jgi:hypothetical protein
MAAGGEYQQQHSKGRQRLLFVVEERRIPDLGYDRYLVFKINLKDMFASAAAGEEVEDWAMEMRSFPRPVAQIDTLRGRMERLDLAAVGTGSIVVAVSCDRRTVIYDTAAAAEAPCGRELRYCMPGGTTLIPWGKQLYAVPNHLWPPNGGDTVPCFQALEASGGGGRWSWRALPTSPRDLYKRLPPPAGPFCFVTAVLAAGTRVWVSAPDRGTYSFDTAGRLGWRKEGDWELPFEGRGLFVPDLGLCFGICSRRLCLCAFDAPTTAAGGAGRPPVERYVWQDETYPPPECRDRGFYVRSPGSLGYLGDGKLCITWTIGIEYAEQERSMVPSRFALLLVAVQVVRCGGGGELRLVKHKVRCYKMSSHGIDGYVLQPSLV